MPTTDPVDQAIALAERLLRESLADTTRAERRQMQRLGKLVDDESGRELVQRLTDHVLRIHQPRRAARRFRDVVSEIGTPASLGPIDRLLLSAGAIAVPLAPRLLMPLLIGRIRRETKATVISAADPGFAQHVARRRAEGIDLNINVLGEAILSDAEADRRLASVLARLARPDVEYISVKISALCANLDPLAFDYSVGRICERLRTLYRQAQATSPAAFVNLDMEEFKDLDLTVAACTRVLDEPEFNALDAGIVLQAYLPDSHAVLEHLGPWAAARQARAGGTIKIRLVKGANLAMEQVEAETHGWNQAPYRSKAEVDASYKAMLASALRPDWAAAVRVGLASHNLFDVAWGLVQRERLSDPQRIEFEMLEGMASAQARAVLRAADGLLLYVPVVKADEIDASIAYLSRRLDENTAPDNFLRALFTLHPDSKEFAEQAQRFRDSVADSTAIATVSQRHTPLPAITEEFGNEPDGDFTDTKVRQEALGGRDHYPLTAAIVTSTQAIDALVAAASAAQPRWAAMTIRQRRDVLWSGAAEMHAERAATLSIMANEAGKTIREGDPEISEAIDFARYYATTGVATLGKIASETGVAVTPVGVVLVVAPWNFPYAIAAGGICAALAAGNAVVFKPAPQARRTGWALVQQLWRAGVPRDVLHYVACEDDDIGRHLVTHIDVAAVVLTGSFDTATMFTSWKPELRLLAETSGKNALIITAAADIDAALRDLVRSAFGHAGQKCSAASLAIIDAAVYDDPTFLTRLRDCALSMTVGNASDEATIVGPLIQAPTGPLARALTSLEPGETWLLEPRPLDHKDPTQARLWQPGIRLGVAAGSWFHLTECFGPVLGVMRASGLDEAIELQNATSYGLTGGIHSLDPAEVAHWADKVEVGNAYINRHITGAIVQRQPFGGWKRSSIGCGSKAGGPDYLVGLSRVVQRGGLDVQAALQSQRQAWEEHFSRDHDPSKLRSEANVLRYRPLQRVLVRHDQSADAAQLLLRHAASICGVHVEFSDASTESEAALQAHLEQLRPERVRLLTEIGADLQRWMIDNDIAIDRAAVTTSGRYELSRWTKEQAISETCHRYGRLTAPLHSSGGNEQRP